VIVTGDIHSLGVHDVKADFRKPESATVAAELVGTSISSAGVPYELFAKFLPQNPHVKPQAGLHPVRGGSENDDRRPSHRR